MVRKILLVVLCLLVAQVPGAGVALAQEKRSPSILEFFGIRPAKPKVTVKKPSGPKAKAAPASKKRTPARKKPNPTSQPRQSGSSDAARALGADGVVEGGSEIAEKSADAKPVLVIGDFMADGVSEGLEDAFKMETGVVAISHANGSSGFVRDDYFNWPQQAGAIIGETRPAAIVVMIGTNDRQPMLVNGVREAVLSPVWTAEYERRVKAFAEALKFSGIPVIWIGMPPFKQNSMSADMLALNDIYRKSAEAISGRYVDIWEGFLDEQGTFSINGFDYNGQPARLRASDGINLTFAGKRKIAFFAEKPVREALGALGTPNVLAPAMQFDPFNLPGPRKPSAKEFLVITRTQPVSLFDPVFDGASELLGANLPKPDAIGSPANSLYRDGAWPATVPGRIDERSIAAQPRG